MDTDEEPRMSGALPPRDTPENASTETKLRETQSGADDAMLLGVPGNTETDKSRSPSVLNDVDIGAIQPPVAAITIADTSASASADPCLSTAPPLSKNQQKKLKRQQKWEDDRESRKRKRKEKRLHHQAEKRARKDKEREELRAAGLDPDEIVRKQAEEAAAAAAAREHILVPVSLIFDCDFETYMRETELISLASQITRSYSANRTATRQAHIFVSSWGGKLQSRYETLLRNQHKRWSNVYFLEDDYRAAGRQAEALMKGPDGGKVVDLLEAKEADGDAIVEDKVEGGGEAEQAKPHEETSSETKPAETEKADAEPEKLDPELASVVYLTSDSPYTLTRLEPNTSYVIGGIVDKNREKGLCYGRAKAHGIRTAKLPIGDYMVMASRKVLTTNHVVEIMLNWLETGDWASAFDKVIPKRKGGVLRESGSVEELSTHGEDDDAGNDEPADEGDAAVQHTGENDNAVTTEDVPISEVA